MTLQLLFKDESTRAREHDPGADPRRRRPVQPHPVSSLRLASVGIECLDVHRARDARAVLRRLRHRMEHLHHTRRLPGLQPPVAVDVVPPVRGLVAPRRLVRTAGRPASQLAEGHPNMPSPRSTTFTATFRRSRRCSRSVRRVGVDRIVVGGDVLPGPLPRESLTLLRELDLPVAFIMGNGDREVLTRMRGSDPDTLPPPVREMLRWNARQLDAEHAGVIAAWPPTLPMAFDGIGDILFCHATPRNDVDIFTRDTPAEQVLPTFDGVDADLVVCGHTHMQFDRDVGRFAWSTPAASACRSRSQARTGCCWGPDYSCGRPATTSPRRRPRSPHQLSAGGGIRGDEHHEPAERAGHDRSVFRRAAEVTRRDGQDLTLAPTLRTTSNTVL